MSFPLSVLNSKFESEWAERRFCPLFFIKSQNYSKILIEGDKLCPKCNYHYLLSARERIALLCDENSFEEADAGMTPGDPLKFADPVPYPEKQAGAQKKSIVDS